MKITASIVTYNNENEILKVLKSLTDSTTSGLHIIVVDNASIDKTKKLVEENYPNVELISSPKNIGFGAGHNIAVERVESDYHIFINPDITVEHDQISKMIEYLEEHEDVVVLTPKVLNDDGTEQFLPKVFPKWRYIISGKFEHKCKICYKWRSQYTFRDRVILEPVEIQYSTGCFMVCRTDALREVGGFDERYFLHFEDADLTRKMMQQGKVIYNPYVHVTHGWQRENIKNRKIGMIALQSLFKYYRKWGFFKN